MCWIVPPSSERTHSFYVKICTEAGIQPTGEKPEYARNEHSSAFDHLHLRCPRDLFSCKKLSKSGRKHYFSFTCAEKNLENISLYKNTDIFEKKFCDSIFLMTILKQYFVRYLICII